MTRTSPWGSLDLPHGRTVQLDVGTLHLEVKRTPTEAWVRPSRPHADREVPEEEWRRWSLPEDAGLELRPAVPDRLLVVAHEYPFRLPAHRRARVYVRVPLFAQMVARSPEIGEIVIADEPGIVLSDTWWGTWQEGELAYWLSTTARAQVTDDLFVPHAAMCPIHLENVSAEALPVDRFAVRAQHLSLFGHGRRIWTDDVRVRYQAAAEGSEIRFGGGAPEEAPDARMLAGPRIPLRRGLQARTFDRLRALSMLGG